ncbi:receptor-type tyrosine-protein phosphatase T-like [Saccostrea echinata]|uniref:receptor-type tyrosine-protein phosphatase T-like n=1 Tax=Saccostrea echinata TaxID=191078 RepID=UPI002A839193|nr:receptor-type tyrosine-protein phosphatase T-like [Saccostrea echinata]
MYGNNCNQSCGHCLNNAQCYHINGTCLDGCFAGYEGQLCMNKCNEVSWGINCKMNCSTECVNQTCHHVSGDCYMFKQPLKTSLDSFSSLPVIVGVVVLIAVLVIGVILATLLRRRARALEKDNRGQIKKKNERDRATSPTDLNNIVEDMEGNSQSAQKTSKVEGDDDIDNDEKIHEENPYGDLYVNERTIPDINVEELECTIEEKRKNEDDGFKREYAGMPYGERYPCNAGKQPDNLPKNRYKTTFPYDHSRIKLLNSQSNYINANFIDGIDKINAYIASQGPRQNTVTDFWTMIWQEEVNQIVMVTNLIEGKKTKCFKYWPDLHQSSTFGVISLRGEEEKIYAYYNIRKFRITNKVQKKSRMVTQYHYTAWPDHGTPDPLCLVVFHDHVTRSKDTQNGGPTLVHCSAGIGRTGTYIAIDALYKAGKTNRKINIAEYVKKMRENRMNMVQTYEQYMTIFLALDSIFKAPTYLHTKSEFVRRAELMTRDKPVNKCEIREEFQNLLKVRPSYTEVDYKVALQSGHSKSSVLPLDKYSVFLSSSVPKRGNYINAVTLPSYTNPNAFIVTQYPSSEDAVDFLRLLTDHESDLLICMDPLNDIKPIKTWLPVTNNSKTVFPFTVQCGHQQVTDIKCTTISITQRGSDQGSPVSIVEPKGSLKNAQLSQASEQMLRMVTFALQSDTEGAITIVSSDGASLCGVFCSVYNVLQQLSMDGEVDIFSTVRQLQIRRPELCSSMEEYRMIYGVVLDYIRVQEDSSKENVYYNQ